jgi:hypothetical protein
MRVKESIQISIKYAAINIVFVIIIYYYATPIIAIFY